MENQSPVATSPVEALLTTQLQQWQQLKADLEARPDPDYLINRDILYCEAKQIELSNEIALLR